MKIKTLITVRTKIHTANINAFIIYTRSGRLNLVVVYVGKTYEKKRKKPSEKSTSKSWEKTASLTVLCQSNHIYIGLCCCWVYFSSYFFSSVFIFYIFTKYYSNRTLKGEFVVVIVDYDYVQCTRAHTQRRKKHTPSLP